MSQFHISGIPIVDGDKLVGIARAMFDGLSAVIMEFCLELEYQGENLEYENGSLIGKDESGLGKRTGEVLVKVRRKKGRPGWHYDDQLSRMDRRQRCGHQDRGSMGAHQYTVQGSGAGVHPAACGCKYPVHRRLSGTD